MKTWAMMYGIIWAAFFQILVVLFPALGASVALGIHLVLGVIVLALAYLIYVRVRATSCPDRIKRITKATFGFAVFETFLGVALYEAQKGNSGLLTDSISFLHVAVALAIITQASSSATAFDMWEEKEFMEAPKTGA